MPTCNIPGRGALVLRSIFLRCRTPGPETSAVGLSDPSSLVSVMVGTCSMTVRSGSFVARRFVMRFECSFYKKVMTLKFLSSHRDAYVIFRPLELNATYDK